MGRSSRERRCAVDNGRSGGETERKWGRTKLSFYCCDTSEPIRKLIVHSPSFGLSLQRTITCVIKKAYVPFFSSTAVLIAFATAIVMKTTCNMYGPNVLQILSRHHRVKTMPRKALWEKSSREGKFSGKKLRMLGRSGESNAKRRPVGNYNWACCF